MDLLDRVLKEKFGHDQFRPSQREVVVAAMEKRDIMLVMPTGGGKSLCFQLPAYISKGITFVVSPLIALMKDQVESLERVGVPATFLNSTLTPKQKDQRMSEIEEGKYKLVYLAPERIDSAGFIPFVHGLDISRLVVDEAHCISSWGHDFRPDYRKIDTLRTAMGNPPITAVTATATPKVRDDIMIQCGMRDPFVLVTGFNRPNLTLKGNAKPDGKSKDMALLRVYDDMIRDGTPSIVYCTSRKQTEEVAKTLNKLGYGRKGGQVAMAYHAALKKEEREKAQDAFLGGKINVIAATIAFGMGVDKPDIRRVVHATLPSSVEAYYQEVGRAGRDGLPSECTLYYSGWDISTREFFIECNHPERHIFEMILSYMYRKLSPKFVTKMTYDRLAGELTRDNIGQGKIKTALTLLKSKGAFFQPARGQMMLPAGQTKAPDVNSLGIDFRAIQKRKKLELERLEQVMDLVEADDKMKFILDYFGADA